MDTKVKTMIHKESLLYRVLNHELSGGIFLILCTIFSLAITNSPVGEGYLKIWDTPMFGENLAHWVNDGLMAIFFLYVGLELKQEIYYGELRNIKTAALPIFAAMGGMLIPAGFYIMLNFGNAETMGGAGIPMATDIAFALAVITLVGKNVPFALRLFLTALAVIDDLGAIIVIAIFYTHDLSLAYMAVALLILAGLFIMNTRGVKSLLPYIIGGIAAWYCMLNSGIHATIAGVLLAFTIPSNRIKSESLSYMIEVVLAKPVAFIILPLFALASTAVTVDASSTGALAENYGLGILLGLVVGKPIGITLFSFIACKLKVCSLPSSINWKMVFGAGMLGGIGFTMSIFITMLAFNDVEHINNAKFSILVSSMVAAVAGFIYLKIVCHKPLEASESAEEANA